MKFHDMDRRRMGYFLFLMLIAPNVMGTSLPAVPLEESADVIVILAPRQDYGLNVPMSMERSVNGQIIKLEKGSLGVRGLPEAAIVHTPNTITSPLKQGVPKRLFLKKFPDRDTYYVIGVGPVQQGGKQ